MSVYINIKDNMNKKKVKEQIKVQRFQSINQLKAYRLRNNFSSAKLLNPLTMTHNEESQHSKQTKTQPNQLQIKKQPNNLKKNNSLKLITKIKSCKTIGDSEVIQNTVINTNKVEVPFKRRLQLIRKTQLVKKTAVAHTHVSESEIKSEEMLAKSNKRGNNNKLKIIRNPFEKRMKLDELNVSNIELMQSGMSQRNTQQVKDFIKLINEVI